MRLSPNSEMLFEEFRQKRPELLQLDAHVYELLTEKFKTQGIELNSIEHRVKAEDSLMGKLERKGEKYHQLSDITDLVGLRIVTFYTDDVDKAAAIVSQLFNIDWKNSVDKRKMHDFNSFGYNSLHYICTLKEGSLPFEIQIRTALQHTWSAIEHDIGYKGVVKLPPQYRRQFSRLAGMLELADDEFSRLRTTMTEYRRQIQTLVKSGNLSDVALSTDSFRSYLDLRPLDRLNQRIAAVNQAELFPASLMPFLPVLEHFGMESLGEVQNMVDTLSDAAYQLALAQLAVTDLDILSESVGMQNLCIVYALKHGGGSDDVKLIYDTLYGANESNTILANAIIQQYAATGQQ
jgi:ppGpp synthetase/RelA/SpoT-type nucleotidyltranferase